MFNELNKYKKNGHFFLTQEDKLKDVCNAPEKQIGIFLTYALKNGRVELVFIGGTGEVTKKELNSIQDTGTGGLKDQLINGMQFTDVSREISWPAQMKKENIEALDVYWYVTHSEEYIDSPGKVENILFERHYQLFQRMPRWNSDL